MEIQRQQGVSLLELLLVVLGAAAIVSGAVMYFGQTMSGSRVSQAANLIEQINKAGHEWLQMADENGVYPTDFSNLSKNPLDGNSLHLFVQQDLVPCENNSCFQNPWGGSTMVSVDPGYPQYMLITLSQLPAADCQHLRQQMKNIAPEEPINQNSCQAATGSTTYQIYL